MRAEQQGFAKDQPVLGAYFPGSDPLAHSASARLDTLRGLACLLLVLFHAVVEVRLRHSTELQSMTSVNEFLAFLRMPLFTFLSGYVYAMRPLGTTGRGHFVRRKAERLLIPLLFITLLTVVAHAVAGSASTANIGWELYTEIGRPSFHLWFLQALFLIFLMVALGVGRLLRSAAGCVVILLAVAIAEAVGATQIRLFSIGQAIGLMPYFMAGVLTRSWYAERTISTNERLLAVAAIVLIAGLRVLQLEGMDVPSYRTALPALLCVFIAMPTIPWLAALGRRSTAIYLFHALVLAAVARHLPGPEAAVLLQLMVLGLAVPMFLLAGTERWVPALLPLLGGGIRRPAPEPA